MVPTARYSATTPYPMVARYTPLPYSPMRAILSWAAAARPSPVATTAFRWPSCWRATYRRPKCSLAAPPKDSSLPLRSPTSPKTVCATSFYPPSTADCSPSTSPPPTPCGRSSYPVPKTTSAPPSDSLPTMIYPTCTASLHAMCGLSTATTSRWSSTGPRVPCSRKILPRATSSPPPSLPIPTPTATTSCYSPATTTSAARLYNFATV